MVDEFHKAYAVYVKVLLLHYRVEIYALFDYLHYLRTSLSNQNSKRAQRAAFTTQTLHGPLASILLLSLSKQSFATQ